MRKPRIDGHESAPERAARLLRSIYEMGQGACTCVRPINAEFLRKTLIDLESHNRAVTHLVNMLEG